MTDARDRLFIGTLVFSLVMTFVFGGALAWDIANNRGGSGATSQRTVTTGDATPDAGTAGSSTGGSAGGGSGGGGGTSGGATANNQAIAPGADITIGALITQSGPLDASDAFRADEAFVQMTNAAGGINGHKLRLDVKDDQGNPAVGRPGFEQIVQEDHALALVGECAPLTDAAIVNEINSSQVPIVNDCLTSAPAYSSPYIWFTLAAPSTWQGSSANYLYKHQDQLKMHKPYVLCVNTSVTIPYCDGFVNQWKANGGTTCSGGKCNGGYDQEQIATTRIQYDGVASNIKQSGADSIVAELEPTNQAAFLQALTDQGMCPSNGWTQYAPLGMDPASIRAGGGCANGVYVSSNNGYFPSEGTPGEQQLAQALQRYQPDTPVDNYSLSIGWTPMQLFAEAVRRAGANVSRQGIINALNSMSGYDTNGLCRPIQWTAASHGAPNYTRWAKISGPTSYDVQTGWVDGNGNG